MFTKKHIVYFVVLFLPTFIVSVLFNIVYSLQTHGYIQINWLVVIVLAIGLDAFITWRQNRKKDISDKVE